MGSAASCFILTSLNYLQVIFFSPYKTSGYYNTCKSKNTNRKKRVLLISCFYNFIFVLFWFCIRVRIRFRFWTRYWVWNFRRVFFHCNNKCLCLLCISNCNSITSCFLRIESTAINCCCLCHIRCFSAFIHWEQTSWRRPHEKKIFCALSPFFSLHCRLSDRAGSKR